LPHRARIRNAGIAYSYPDTDRIRPKIVWHVRRLLKRE